MKTSPNFLVKNKLLKNFFEIGVLIEKKHGNLESRIDSRSKKLNWGEIRERNIPEKCAITITICKRDDAT